jgi:hypothetical protein
LLLRLLERAQQLAVEAERKLRHLWESRERGTDKVKDKKKKNYERKGKKRQTAEKDHYLCFCKGKKESDAVNINAYNLVDCER